MALNFAARVITARAQWIQHQMLQQHQKSVNLEQNKLSQMIQIAQFQAYLALMNKATTNKTENASIENKDTSQ